jgi:hypothetical protein
VLPNSTNYDLVDNLFVGGRELEKPEIIELLEEREGDANNATFIQSTNDEAIETHSQTDHANLSL